MTVQALGYVGVRAEGVEDWSSYAGGLLGLQRVDKGRKTRAFRMDDRKQRIVVDGSGGRASPSSAGKSRTPPRSTRSPRGSKRPA